MTDPKRANARPKRSPRQQAVHKGLTPHDINELEKFRAFLRLKGSRAARYKKVYGESP